MGWCKLPISLSELCIDTTLRCGQSFRWKKSAESEIYSCAFNGRLISLRQDLHHLHYRTIKAGQRAYDECSTSSPEHELYHSPRRGKSADEDEVETFLHQYLNLGPNLGSLYEQWSIADSNFRKKAPKFTGVRILRQDAWEALVGFICSSNNNIARISQMMEKLCVHYGSLVGHVDDVPFYDVPSPSALTGPRVEGHLRELGFGYRARYIYHTAVKICRQPEDWLDSLRNPETQVSGKGGGDAGELLPGGRDGYRVAHESLLELQGVGPKVADCVCLMGLGWGEAVPVDTHVWQIAQRDYHFGKGRNRSLTKATYDAVADHFRALWGKEAGWAHSVLFTADLRAFSKRLIAKLEIKEESILGDRERQAKAEEQSDEKLRGNGFKVEAASALPAKQEIKPEAKAHIKAEQIIIKDSARSRKDDPDKERQYKAEIETSMDKYDLPKSESIGCEPGIKIEHTLCVERERKNLHPAERAAALGHESSSFEKEPISLHEVSISEAGRQVIAAQSFGCPMKEGQEDAVPLKAEGSGAIQTAVYGPTGTGSMSVSKAKRIKNDMQRESLQAECCSLPRRASKRLRR